MSDERRHGKIVDQSRGENIAMLRVRGKEMGGARNGSKNIEGEAWQRTVTKKLSSI